MSRARDLSKIGNINTFAVDSTDTQVGIASTVPNATLDVGGDGVFTGIVTATSFSGSGSGLTGVASTDNIITGTAATFRNTAVSAGVPNVNIVGLATVGILTAYGDIAGTTGTFSGAISGTTGTFSAAVSGTTGTFSGAVNVDATTDSTSSTSGALIVDGGLGVAKNVYIGAGLSVAGTLTYEDVTSVDSVGLITAKSGVNITGGELTVGSGITMGIAGVATFSGTSDVHLHDNVRLNIGDASDLSIYHNGTHSYIEDSGTGRLVVKSSYFEVDNAAGNAAIIEGIESGAVKLYYSGNEKLVTTKFGTVTTGIATATNGFSGNIIGYAATMTGAISLTAGSGANVLVCTDNSRIGLGNDADLVLYYDGPNEIGYINQINGTPLNLQIGNSTKLEINKFGTVTTGIATATSFDSTSSSTFNDRVYWKSSGTTKMSTLASNAGMNWQDSVKAEFGNSGDLKIYHESNVNYIYGGSTNFPIAFMTNATERLRIKGDGETNIGTGATTIAKFCMTGASNGGHQIVGQASNNVAALDVYSQHGSDANKLSFAVSDNRTGSKSNSFVVRGDGRIGIGLTNPTSPLDITGGSDNTIIQIRSTDAGAYMTAIDNTGAGSFGQQGAATVITCDSAASVADSAIVFQIDANNEKMRLDNSGRLLIGTTTEGHSSADDITIASTGQTTTQDGS